MKKFSLSQNAFATFFMLLCAAGIIVNVLFVGSVALTVLCFLGVIEFYSRIEWA